MTQMIWVPGATTTISGTNPVSVIVTVVLACAVEAAAMLRTLRRGPDARANTPSPPSTTAMRNRVSSMPTLASLYVVTDLPSAWPMPWAKLVRRRWSNIVVSFAYPCSLNTPSYYGASSLFRLN